jgi:tetratricopeptide (TPR) repeat protein
MPEKATAKKKLNPQQERELDITIGFLEGIVRRDPHYVEALQLLGDDYTKRGHFTSGLQVDEQLATLRPDDAGVQYNLACSYSLTEQYELAIKALNRALELGYDEFKFLARDPDLKNLRAHPLYEPIRAKLREQKISEE